jgi:PadR family transcriptional regulator AphA
VGRVRGVAAHSPHNGDYLSACGPEPHRLDCTPALLLRSDLLTYLPLYAIIILYLFNKYQFNKHYMSPMIKTPLTIEHALLGFLRQRPMHAYEIHQTLLRAEALGLVWHLKQSLVYLMLDRLEEAGHISVTLEPQGSRPPRKILHLTSGGREEFARWLVAPVAHGRDFRLEFLAKLYFASQNNPANAATLIATQQLACRDWLVDLRAQADALSDVHDYDWLVVQFRIGQIEAIMAWLDICAATVIPAPV